MTHHDVSHQSRHEKNQGTWPIILGCASIGAYMLLFTAGGAIDSAPYRARLALVANGAQATSSSAGSVSSAVTPVAVSFLTAFVLVMVLFTPVNVAFLTLIAAFIGGCASNITYTRSTMRSDSGINSGEAPSVSVLFRTESPFASMFRGFVVYLAFMAGIYITTANPFGTPTAEQYVRLAATLSLFSFIVGYDPTKFADFLKLLPGPRSAAQK